MNGWLQQAALWTWQNSLAAGALAAAVLAMRRVFRGRIAPRWLCLAGWLVMLRLFLPAPFPHAWAWDRAWTLQKSQVPVTGKNVIKPAVEKQPSSLEELRDELTAARATLEVLTTTIPGSIDAEAAPAVAGLVTRAQAAAVAPAVEHLSFDWMTLAANTWLLGVVLYFSFTVIRHQRFLRRVVRTATPVVLPWPGLAEECARSAGLRNMPPLLTVPGGGTPFLFGLFRPRIILPAECLAALAPREARHVLLHEMLHVAKRDLLSNWLLAAARALHWFNPLIHAAFRQLLADRELLRDHQVLTLLRDPVERNAYGHTLLKLALPLTAPAPSPGLAPLFHSEKELKRRLTMIHSPHRHQRLAACAAAVTLTVLSVFLFTTVRGQEASVKPEPASSAENTGTPGPEVKPLQSLEDQIRTEEKSLEDARSEVLDVMKTSHIVDIPGATGASPRPESRVIDGSLEKQPNGKYAAAKANYEAQLQMLNRSKLEQDVNKMETQLKSLRDLKGEQLIASAQSLDVQDATIIKVYPEYLTEKAQLSSLIQKGFGKKHPEMRGLRESITTKYKQLETAVESYKSSLKVQIEVSKQMLADAGKVTKDKTTESVSIPGPSATGAANPEAPPVRVDIPTPADGGKTDLTAAAYRKIIEEHEQILEKLKAADDPKIKESLEAAAAALAARGQAMEALVDEKRRVDEKPNSRPQRSSLEHLRGIAEKLRAKGQTDEAAAIEEEVRALTPPQTAPVRDTYQKLLQRPAATGDELQQLRAEVAGIKAALAELQAKRVAELSSDLEKTERDMAAALGAGMGKKHPMVLALRDKMAAMHRQTDSSDAGEEVRMAATPSEKEDSPSGGPAGRRYTIMGSVLSPGSYNFPDGEELALIQAIGTAGGFTRTANSRKVTIIRAGQTIKVDANKLVKEGGSEPVAIQPGDVINVPEANNNASRP